MRNLLVFLPLFISLCSATGCAMLQDAGILPPERSAISPYGYFERTGNMHIPRAGHTATLLPNGKVLIAGGYTLKKVGKIHERELVKQAELYDPKTGQFTLTGRFNEPHNGTYSFYPGGINGNGILLPNNKVFFVGLPSTHAELYNITTGHFELSGAMLQPRQNGYVQLLNNDKNVILVGGTLPREKKITEPASAMQVWQTELFDIKSGKFKLGSVMPALKGFRVGNMHGRTLIDNDWLLYYSTPQTLAYSIQKNSFKHVKSTQKYFDNRTWYILPSNRLLLPDFEGSPFGFMGTTPPLTFENIGLNKLKRFKPLEDIAKLAQGHQLSDHVVLFIGGGTRSLTSKEARLYDHNLQKLYPLPKMLNEHGASSSVSQLNANKALICGGTDGFKKLSNHCEIFHNTYRN